LGRRREGSGFHDSSLQQGSRQCRVEDFMIVLCSRAIGSAGERVDDFMIVLCSRAVGSAKERGGFHDDSH